MENSPAGTTGQPTRARTVSEALTACDDLGRTFNAVVETLPADPHSTGLPIAVKDVIDIAGSVTTMGSHVRPADPATASAAVIELCEHLGMVPVAKTTCQEHSYGILGEESAHGRGINPIWPGYATGGSSYGSAIAVATGVVPAAIGTDTAGSVRVPAACAAITGFKPTLGRIPTTGVAALSTSFDTVGFLTRTPAELAELWEPIAATSPGPVPGQAAVPEAGETGRPVAARDAGQVRIGVFAADGLVESATAHPCDRAWVHNRVRPWLDARVDAAAGAGAEIEIVDLSGAFDLDRIAAVYSTIRGRESWLIHQPAWESGRRDYQPQVRANIEHDQTVTEADYQQALADCAGIRAAAAEVFETVDVILTPTMGCETVRWADADQSVRRAFRLYTQLFNILGWPAISIPIETLPRLLTGEDGQVEAHFPASIQLAAAPWRDSELTAFTAWLAGLTSASSEGIAGSTGTAGEAASAADEQVVLLTDDGQVTGTAAKADVHTEKTPLHQAFSCFVFDDTGRVLLTRRALNKKTWPGVWTNALCGHPGAGEPIAAAVHRRAAEELGCRLADLDTILPAFRYRATDASGVVENEICPVYTARLESELDPAADEVAEHAWVDAAGLDAAVAAVPFMFSPWMREEWQLLRKAQRR